MVVGVDDGAAVDDDDDDDDDGDDDEVELDFDEPPQPATARASVDAATAAPDSHLEAVWAPRSAERYMVIT
ncbi:MAG: hypothetical protein E6G05_09725 [Actinobacteria bacterium]|nr:MAG: hypothetical protein E6G05_09725 [Actinomycetota bacterium]